MFWAMIAGLANHLGAEDPFSIVPGVQKIEPEDCSYAEPQQSLHATFGVVFRLFHDAAHLLSLPISIGIIMIDTDDFPPIPLFLPCRTPESVSQVNKDAKFVVIDRQFHGSSPHLKVFNRFTN
jgi:hypothetical protein